MNQICPKCGCAQFQLIPIDIENCYFKYMSVSCKCCGHSLGVINQDNEAQTTVKYGKEILDKLTKLTLSLSSK